MLTDTECICSVYIDTHICVHKGHVEMRVAVEAFLEEGIYHVFNQTKEGESWEVG